MLVVITVGMLPLTIVNQSPKLVQDSVQTSLQMNEQVVSMTSNATSGEICAHRIATIGCPDDTAVSEKDWLVNTIEGDKASEDMLVNGCEIASCYQEKLQTKIVDGHSDTLMEKRPVCQQRVVSVEQKISTILADIQAGA